MVPTTIDYPPFYVYTGIGIETNQKGNITYRINFRNQYKSGNNISIEVSKESLEKLIKDSKSFLELIK